MKKFIVSVLVVLVGILITIGSLNYAGVCIAEGRILSDEEQINIAITDANSRNGNWRDKSNGDLYKISKYPDAAALKSEAPNCCSKAYQQIDFGETPPRDLLPALLGLDNGYVFIKFPASYKYVDGTEGRGIEKRDYNMQNCGVVN